MITDSSGTALSRPALNQTQLYLLSEVVIYLLPVCRCQRTIEPSNAARGILDFRVSSSFQTQNGVLLHFFPEVVGVTGFEPVTLRLSSACSNQLSYTPMIRISAFNWEPVASMRCIDSDPGLKWRHGDSNPRPIACKATALPTELYPQKWILFPCLAIREVKQKLNCALPFQTLELLALSVEKMDACPNCFGFSVRPMPAS